jgi:hypothetical protein
MNTVMKNWVPYNVDLLIILTTYHGRLYTWYYTGYRRLVLAGSAAVIRDDVELAVMNY